MAATQQTEATRKRLREAEFFWHRLSTVDRPTVISREPEAPEFYLNAFVSAARSVEWVLQKERPDDWDAWITGWKAQLSDQDNAVRRYFVDQRNKIAKEGAPDLTFTVTPVSLMEFMQQASLQGASVQIYPGVPGTPPPTYTMLEKSLTDHPGRTLSAACQPFLELTRRLVDDFEREHPPT